MTHGKPPYHCRKLSLTDEAGRECRIFTRKAILLLSLLQSSSYGKPCGSTIASLIARCGSRLGTLALPEKANAVKGIAGRQGTKTMSVISAASAQSLGHYLHPFRMGRELWAHREFIAQLTRREITQRYRGPIWVCCGRSSPRF
jgi:hypothetical protein